jgi:hypothetical protein
VRGQQPDAEARLDEREVQRLVVGAVDDPRREAGGAARRPAVAAVLEAMRAV